MTSRLALVLLVAAALAVRFYDLTQPIVRFHATRHYRSAVLARACFYDVAIDVAPEARAVAAANRGMQPSGELPLMEWLACNAYQVIGREEVIIPRALAALFWVAGALPVWWLARRFTTPGEASQYRSLVAVALYLFLPYGIVASRNFQPDPLMTFAALLAIVAIVRHGDVPARRRFAVAAAAIGAAGLIKPMSIFLTVPTLLALASSARSIWLLALGLAAPAMYYGYSAVAGSLVQDQMQLRFVPALVATKFFWDGLATQISRVETWPLFVLAIAGAVLARDRVARRVLVALFAGYAAFAVAFTYHMPTHDYYHLPYIAAVSIGLAVLADRIFPSPVSGNRAWKISMLLACVVVAVGGSLRALPRLRVPDADVYQRVYQEIGSLADYSTRVLFLDPEYGYSLMYHAQLAGDTWPNQDDLAAEALDGRPVLDAEARFVRDYADWGPRYFVVTDIGSFNASPDLQRLLDRRAVPLRITNRYRVYEFTRPIASRRLEQAQHLDHQQHASQQQ
jgi:hypothetical protein